MERITTIEAMDAHRGCGLVPTMGALHPGHLSLIERMRSLIEDVVVTVFVNPAQFNDPEDLDRYPRTLEADLAAAASAGATTVFAPSVDTIYPADAPVWQPALPRVARVPGLEDAHRPGHFDGVCKVVARLFDLAQPALAIFGEKDWQQMRVLESMVQDHADRWPGLRMLRGETVRESDGLAMSSRNMLLTSAQRDRALGLSRALAAAGEGEDAMHKVLDEHGLETEYAVIRDAATLEPVDAGSNAPARALIAARLDAVRLIDNASC